jgi:hypothetical protein
MLAGEIECNSAQEVLGLVEVSNSKPSLMQQHAAAPIRFHILRIAAGRRVANISDAV